jgi:hypothetical protein
MLAWLNVAAEPAVVRRAAIYAVVVGAVVIAINHGDTILRSEVGTGRLLRMALTVLVPYAVSTASSVGAIREARRAPSSSQQQL